MAAANTEAEALTKRYMDLAASLRSGNASLLQSSSSVPFHPSAQEPQPSSLEASVAASESEGPLLNLGVPPPKLNKTEASLGYVMASDAAATEGLQKQGISFSPADTADSMVTQLQSRLMVLSTRLDIAEGQVGVSKREIEDLKGQLEDAYDKQDETEAALGRARDALWRHAHRPDTSTTSETLFSTAFRPALSDCSDASFVVSCLRALPCFGPLPTSALSLLAAHAKIIQMKPSSKLSSVSRLRRSLCIVLKGALRSPTLSVGPGGVVGSHHLFGRTALPGTANDDFETFHASVLAVVSPRIFRRLVLSEAMLLNAWDTPALHAVVSPVYSPVHVSHRFGLVSDVAWSSVMRHVLHYKSAAHHVARAGAAVDIADGIVEDDVLSGAAGNTPAPAATVASTARLVLTTLDAASSVTASPELLLCTLLAGIRSQLNCVSAHLVEVDIRRDVYIQRVGPFTAASSHVSMEYPTAVMLTDVAAVSRPLAGAVPFCPHFWQQA